MDDRGRADAEDGLDAALRGRASSVLLLIGDNVAEPADHSGAVEADRVVSWVWLVPVPRHDVPLRAKGTVRPTPPTQAARQCAGL